MCTHARGLVCCRGPVLAPSKAAADSDRRAPLLRGHAQEGRAGPLGPQGTGSMEADAAVLLEAGQAALEEAPAAMEIGLRSGAEQAAAALEPGGDAVR
jgi:hypothetical protein